MKKSEIQKIHRDAVVSLSYVNPWIEYSPHGVSARRYFTESAAWMEASIPMMRRGGVDLVVLSHGNPDPGRLPGAAGFDCLAKCFDAIIQEIERDKNCFLVLSKSDLDRVGRSGKMGILLGITVGPLNYDLAELRNYFRLGVRTVHPFGNDPLVGGYADGPKELGLNRFGREVIREMERLGILVDVAHTNDRTYSEVLRYAKRPLINSHTNCRKLADYQRCSTDSQLRAMARQGGVIGVHFGFTDILKPVDQTAYDKMMKGFARKMASLEKKYREPYEYLQHRNDPFEWPICIGGAIDDGTPIHREPISSVGNHIEHMVKVAGINHVCIGTDYSSGSMPEGVETTETLVNLTAEMLRRGFSEQDVKKIWGGNFLRLLRQCLPA